MTKQSKDTILFLINKELQEEFEYQIDGERDTTLIRELIQIEKEMMYDRASTFDKIVWGELIKNDIEKYLKPLEEVEG